MKQDEGLEGNYREKIKENLVVLRTGSRLFNSKDFFQNIYLQSGLRQAKPRSQEFHPGLPHEWKAPPSAVFTGTVTGSRIGSRAART